MPKMEAPHFFFLSRGTTFFPMAAVPPLCGTCPVCLELVSPSEARPEKACACASPCKLMFDQIDESMKRIWSGDESTWTECDRVIKAAVDECGGWNRGSKPNTCSFYELFDRMLSLSRNAVIMPCCHVSGTAVCVSCLQEAGIKEMQSPDGVARCPMCRAPYSAGFGLLRDIIGSTMGLIRRSLELGKMETSTHAMITASGKIEKGIRTIFSILAIGNSGAEPAAIVQYIWSLINYNMNKVLPDTDGDHVYFVEVCADASAFPKASFEASAAPEDFKESLYRFLNVPVVRSVVASESGLCPGDVIIVDSDTEMTPFGVEAMLKGARPGLAVLDPAGQHVVVLPYSQWTHDRIAVIDETPESPYCGQKAMYKISEISRPAPITVRVLRPICGCTIELGNAPIEVEVQPEGALLWSVGRETVYRTVDFLFATGLIQQMPSCISKIQVSSGVEDFIETLSELLDLIFE